MSEHEMDNMVAPIYFSSPAWLEQLRKSTDRLYDALLTPARLLPRQPDCSSCGHTYPKCRCY